MPLPKFDVRISISYCAIFRRIAPLLPKIASSACIATALLHCVRCPLQNVTLPAGNVFVDTQPARGDTVIQEFKYCVTVKCFLFNFSSKGSKIRKDIKRQKSCIISCLIRKKFKIFKILIKTIFFKI